MAALYQLSLFPPAHSDPPRSAQGQNYPPQVPVEEPSTWGNRGSEFRFVELANAMANTMSQKLGAELALFGIRRRKHHQHAAGGCQAWSERIQDRLL